MNWSQILQNSTNYHLLTQINALYSCVKQMQFLFDIFPVVPVLQKLKNTTYYFKFNC